MSSFKVVYEGDQHDIEAAVLLDSIGSVTDLVSKVNKELGDDKRDLKMRISAPERGSFGIDLSLLTEAAGTVMSVQEEISYTASLVTLITALYKLHQFLGADDPAKTEQQGDTYRVYNNDGDVQEYDADVVQIYLQSEDARDKLNETYRSTKRDERVEGFRIEDPETGEHQFRADREEFERLSGPKEEEEEIRTVEDEEELVTLTRVPLDDPERRWEILWEGERVGVDVEDIGFLAKVQMGDVSFRRGDRLSIDLEREQEYNRTLEDWETTNYIIKTVHNYIPAGEQTDLFDDEQDSS
jgi:hypothetical protein